MKLKDTIQFYVNSLIEELKENGKEHPYDIYNSVLEYCDCIFNRNGLKEINPNDLIHEVMRYNLNKFGLEAEVGSWILSGIMEMYDFVHNTDDKTHLPNNGSKTDNIYDD